MASRQQSVLLYGMMLLVLPKIHSLRNTDCRQQNCARVEPKRKQVPRRGEDKEYHSGRDIVCSVHFSLNDVQWVCFCNRRGRRRCGCCCQCHTELSLLWLDRRGGGQTNDWNLRKFTNSIASPFVALFRSCQHSIYSSHPIWTFSKKCKYHLLGTQGVSVCLSGYPCQRRCREVVDANIVPVRINK